MLEYIKKRQKQLERKWRREAELEAKKEAARVAKMEAEARKQKEIAARKKLLLEQQEDERFHQKHIQRKEKLAEQKWNKQLDILLDQIGDCPQKDDKLEEIKIIIRIREPSLQALDWVSWLSDPLNQRLAALDFEYAMEMFKRDNLMAKRRRRGGRPRGKPPNYVLTFTGNTDIPTRTFDHVTTTFDPDDYSLNEGFTVSYWVRPDALGNTMFALGRKPSTNERFQFGINTDVNFFVGAGKLRTRNTAHGMEVGTWYHWAVTYAGNSSGKTLKVYRDTTLLQETTATWSGTGATGGELVYFGGYSIDDGSEGDEYTAGWACGLDEVAIFDEVKDLATLHDGAYKPTDQTNASGLVGYWRFEEGVGTNVADLSGKGNDGTLTTEDTGLPTWSGDTP